MNGIAQGSLLDITVVYGGKPAGQATILIDDIAIGQTLSNGTLNQISISAGGHTAVAKWKDSNGHLRTGTAIFSALPDSSTSAQIDLTMPEKKYGNLDWIWQLIMKNICE